MSVTLDGIEEVDRDKMSRDSVYNTQQPVSVLTGHCPGVEA